MSIVRRRLSRCQAASLNAPVFQHVAQAAQRADADAAGLQPLAQPMDEHLDDVGLHVLLVGEHAVEDLLLGQRLAAALDQHAQHGMLARRQRQRLVRQA